jgi:PEP-CTERM motif
MKRLLYSTAIVVGAAFFGPPMMAHAAETATYCGPASGQTCETLMDAMVFGEAAKNVMTGFGNIGSQTGLPILKFHSDGGMLQVFIDVANGFATITPTQGASTFNGLDFTIPADATHPFGFGFTQLIFDEQLTPVTGQSTDTFTIQGFTGAHVAVPPIGNESDAADTDKEFAITAVGGTFDEVNVLAPGGFDEIKHIEVAGVCAFTDASMTTCTPVVISTPEPAPLALLGLGVLGTAFAARTRRRRS